MSKHRPPLSTIAVLVAVFAYPLIPYLIVKSRIDKKIASKDAEIMEVTKVTEQAKAAKRKHAQFEEERARLRVELDKLRRILPPQPDEAMLVASVVKTAAISSVTVLEIRRMRETPEPPLIQSEYQVTAKGSLAALHHFFDELRNRVLIINAPAISLRHSGNDWVATARLTTPSMNV